tara:strand:+ start:81 stop:1412 length:1332 start_codon:yes stop_codon:yes gene_type:complete
MGSVFVTQSDRTVKGFAGKEYAVPFFLQFVPGVVIHVVHSNESLKYGGPNTINTIIAKPHITDKLHKRRASLGEKDRYYPLFRTMNDVPSKGDPVLLCTIGKINYYLGPINAISNSPTWNDDPSYVEEIPFDDSNNKLDLSESAKRGETENFNKEILYPRLTKKRKKTLDYGNAVFETTGDNIFEGRHGNSIRIGSRSNNPYIFISNKRNPINTVESILDGGLISITSNGTLTQHLGNAITSPFQLSSDKLTDSLNKIGQLWVDLNPATDPNEIYLYGSENTGETNEQGQQIFKGVNANQILFHSDRITLNTKLDDIFISSKKDIHIGAGRHLTFTTSGGPDVNNIDSVIFQTSNLNIGNPNNKNMQPMVLGKGLQDVLVQIINLLGKLQVTTSLGIQTPLTVGKFPGDVIPGNPISTTISNLESKIQEILSTKHNIEENTSN